MALNTLVDQYARGFSLTEREAEVFSQLVHRVVNPVEIGKKLNISLFTVNNHLKKILEKTKVNSKTELLADFLLFMDKEKPANTANIQPKILILDDEKDLIKMLQHFFESKNIKPYTFDDPIQALDSIRKLKIDVVICDIRMPKLNGVHFLKEVRKLHQYEPGFIFISGYPEEYELETLLDLGAFAFLEKPIDLDRLHRSVWEYILGTHPMGAEPPPFSVCLGDICLSAKHIGFGGFFLEHEKVKSLKIPPLEKGGKIEVEFQLPNIPEKHRALCEVIWKRIEGNEQDGYGLKFLNLATDTKSSLLEFVRAQNILSFIPKG